MLIPSKVFWKNLKSDVRLPSYVFFFIDNFINNMETIPRFPRCDDAIIRSTNQNNPTQSQKVLFVILKKMYFKFYFRLKK